MAAFFLHAKVLDRISESHPGLFESDGGKTDLSKFKTRGAIFEMASVGLFGTVAEVVKVNVYEFFQALDYLRIKSKIQNES